MNKKPDFQWKVYASKTGKKIGIKKVDINPNQKLPVVYRGNDNYELELEVNGETYRKKTIKISKTKATIHKADNTDLSLPYQYFENSIVWLLSVSFKNATFHWRDLIPLGFWSFILFVLMKVGIELSQNDITMAVKLLIDENASKITVLLGVIGFCIVSFLYVVVPTNCFKTENLLLFSSEQFFGLVIGASSFCLASSFFSSSVEMGILNRIKDIFLVLFICFLVHYTRRFYIELNQFIDWQGRLTFAIVLFVTAVFSYIVTT
jgi:hypothetical protein